jgi:hypothetical protein
MTAAGMHNTDRDGVDPTTRTVGVAALLSIAALHFAQIVDTFRETPWLAVAYVALIAACVALATVLLVVNDARSWAGAGLIGLAVILGYIFTRLVGTTFDNEDVGNWACTLGLASLFVEATLVALSVYVLALATAPARHDVTHHRLTANHEFARELRVASRAPGARTR